MEAFNEVTKLVEAKEHGVASILRQWREMEDKTINNDVASKICKTHLGSSWVEAMEAFNEVTKLVEAKCFLFATVGLVDISIQ